MKPLWLLIFIIVAVLFIYNDAKKSNSNGNGNTNSNSNSNSNSKGKSNSNKGKGKKKIIDEKIANITKKNGKLKKKGMYDALSHAVAELESIAEQADKVYKLADYGQNCDDACQEDGRVCRFDNLNALKANKVKRILTSLDEDASCSGKNKERTSEDQPYLLKGKKKKKTTITCYGWGDSDDSLTTSCDYLDEDNSENYRRLCECHFDTDKDWLVNLKECRGADCLDLVSESAEKVERKEYRMMSKKERNKFHNAIKELMEDEIDGTSKYHLLVVSHSAEEAPGAHGGPSFLPWHREFLKMLEIALRQKDSSVFLPYWDSILDSYLPEPKDAIIWSDSFLGDPSGKVESGPFELTNVTVRLNGTNHRYLMRNVGNASIETPFGLVHPAGRPYNESDYEFSLSRTEFNDFNFCNDATFFVGHGNPHIYVGGHMQVTAISPNEPSFFMHHAFVDLMWEKWRKEVQPEDDRESDYPDDADACNEFNYGDSRMRPFTIKNTDGLSEIYTSELYTYAERPACSEDDQDCGSDYLFCENSDDTYKCVSKIKKGGNCTGFEGKKICEKGKCSSEGKCPSGD